MEEINDGAKMSAEAIALTRQLEMEKLDMMTGRIESLRVENDRLKVKHEKSEKDTHEFVAYFQREMEKKDAIVESLNDELTRREEEYALEKESMHDSYEEQLHKLEEQSDSAEVQLRTRLKVLEDKLSGLEAFREMKQVMEQQLDDLKEDLKRQDEKHIATLTNNERKFLAEKARLQKEMERRTAEIQRAARLEAQSGLDADTRKIVTDNRRMGEELRFQLQMTEELQREKKRVEDENRTLAREVALYEEKEKEYARQGHRQGKELKGAQERVAKLEDRIETMQGEFEGERETIRREQSAELEEQTLDAAGLRQLVKLKNKELKHIKKLAQTILDQRTEVEQYFLDALEQVKAQIRDQRLSDHRREVSEFNAKMREATVLPGVQFPRIRTDAGKGPASAGAGAGAQAESGLPTDPHTKVDLRDLNWEDGEKVLRLLFANINNVQGFVDSVPQHSFDANDAQQQQQQQQWMRGGAAAPQVMTPVPPLGDGYTPAIDSLAMSERPEMV